MHRHVRMGCHAVLLAVATIGLSAQDVVMSGGSAGGGQGIRVITGDVAAGPLGVANNPMPAGTGLIFGQAIEGGSTQAVPGALVTLSLAGAAPVRVIADGEGRFVFRDVPKGQFSLEASKSGYATGAYGRLRPGGPTQAITLTDGQQLTNAAIPLWKLGAIAGTILDDSGDPVVGATVRVLKRTLTGGAWQLTPLDSTVQTDDRGMYRYGSLDPGEYVVAVPMSQQPMLDGVKALGAGPMPAGGNMAVSFRVSGGQAGSALSLFTLLGGGTGPAGMTDDGQLLWYPTEFFPNAAAGSRATPVVLPIGSDRTGVDLTLHAERAYVVDGILNGPTGPASGLTVSLYPADAQGVVTPLEAAAARTDGTGHFSFPRVPPGQYTLRVVDEPRSAVADDAPTIIRSGNMTMVTRMVVRNASDPAPPLPTDPTLWLETAVSVGTADLTNLGFSLRTGVRVSGHVDFDGSATRPTSDQLPSIPISLEPADAKTSASTSTARGLVDAGGNFTTIGVPSGSYVLHVAAPSGWTLRSATYNGRDISDQPIDIGDGEIEGVDVVFTDRPSSLSGTVSSGGTADPKAAVIVFPADPSAWSSMGPSPRRLKNVRAGLDGHFSLTLPAGDYLAVAVNDAEAGDWNDPRFLSAIAPAATRVTLADGDKKTEALRTVVAPKLEGGGL